MYRGRPPPRGGYPPPFEGRGPPPPRPYPAPGYRDDRSRPRAPYHSGYHDHGTPDPYRRSPPRRRYPSPGPGSHRGGEYRAGGPPTEKSLSPHGPIPLDHNLVITVGNELTGPSGSAPSRHLDRPEYERSRSRGRSRPRSRSPERSRAKSLGRSKSRPRSQSRSPDRSRAKSRGRSRTRSPDRSRAMSRGRSRTRSPNRSRAKSRGRSRTRSPDQSRAKSRGRSKSRPRSRSKSRSRSRSRSRGRSQGRSYSKGASYARSKSRQRSRSCSASSSSSSSRSRGDAEEKSSKGFKELAMARRRKELEELLTLPTKSILKKRNSEDSPSIRSTDSPRTLDGSMSRLADQLLQAVKGTDPRMVASMLAELRSDPQMARRAGLDAEIKEILNLLGGTTSGTRAQEKVLDDIDDEERFLYGDSEDPKSPPAPEPVLHHSLDLYGDVTEEALYGDYPPQKPATAQPYGRPLQAPPSTDVSYVSRPTINPDQNITVEVPNPSYPPGTEPLEDSERQALEEYEKIQDLLKTIGLDLGVAEITKMAARTKERLHGNKPPPKTPTRRRQYSPDSSDDSQRGRRTRNRTGSSSSSSSRSRSRGRGGGAAAAGWSSDEDDHRKTSAAPKSHKDRDIKELKGEWSGSAAPQSQTPDLSSQPPHPGVPIPTYPPSQVPGMMPPNYPPPGYGQYGNYLPYVPQQWPPMYPPPNIRMPPPTGAEEYPPTLPYKQAYTPELGVKGSAKNSAQDADKASSKAPRVSEEQNNESQKQKVLEERENLKQEREIRMKKKEYLMKELERLRKQQGELLRKKRREKDGHKDPLLQEISHLQEEVMAQISNLRKEHEAAEKKRHEIEKVALILGLSPSDRPRKTAKPPEVLEAEPQTPPQKKKREAEKSPDGRPVASGPTTKQTSETRSTPRASPDKTPVAAPAPTAPPEPFEYYDAGNHWCKNCNATCGSMFDFFTHLHSKTHRKTLDPYDRPWASTPGKISKNLSSEEKLTKPAKGSEFLLPVRGFFCLLCREFYGDAICAEEHVTTHAHNEKYKKQMHENPLYEQRRNLDRQAGLALEVSAKKRKHDDDEKGSKEDKSKHKKEKKEKKKEEDVPKEDKFKMKKEEEEDKLKLSKKEESFKNANSLEKEWPSYSKKDEGEKYKYCKKDDKHRYRREEEERDSRYRYSREEEYRYRYDRDEDDGYNDRPKYGPKDDKDKYKSGKCSDATFKCERERDEGKPKAEREGFKKSEPEKLAVSKPELPPKPYDLPKILCGPSPAMRAKLRKQSLEAGKPAPPVTPTFGKFMWKKKENMLAKEAEKVAAEFIKEDEAAAKEKSISAEDSFAKSVAVAKEIAEKLGSQPSIAAPTGWMSNRGRIRPNLPTPAVGVRKPTMMGRPASLNTFLSIRPPNPSLLGPPPTEFLVLPSSPPSVGNGLLQIKPVPPVNKPGPFEAMHPSEVHKPTLFQVRPPPPVSVLALSEVKPTPPPVSELPSVQSGEATTPTQSDVNPAPAVSEPATVESKPASAEPKILKPFEVNPAPPVSKPAPVDLKPVPVEAKPLPSLATMANPAQPAMIKIVSDVAAPGVPESEQIRTVFVKPPPFMKKSEVQKSDKFKRNLAAAKAQDLFDIFYSSVGQTGPSSFSKPTSDSRTEGSSAGRSSCSVAQAPPKPHLELQPKARPEAQSQPQSYQWPQPQSQSQPRPEPQSQPRPEPQSQPRPEPQSQPRPEPQSQPRPEPQSQPRPEPQSQPRPEPQSLPRPEPQSQPQAEPQPHLQSQPQPELHPELQSQLKSELGSLPQSQAVIQFSPPTEGQKCPRNAPEHPQSPLTPTNSGIQIASVWSLQSSEDSTSELALLNKTNTQIAQPRVSPPPLSEAHSAPQNQSLAAKSDSQILSESQSDQLESTLKSAPEIQTDLQSEPEPNKDIQSYPEPHSNTESEQKPKPGPKTRGKTTPSKKTPPAPRPTRQTRSQTRYQTRQQQQQSQTEPEPWSASVDTAASDPKSLDMEDSGSGLRTEAVAPSEEEPQMIAITAETLGLPSDMASLDFEYDFNFE